MAAWAVPLWYVVVVVVVVVDVQMFEWLKMRVIVQRVTFDTIPFNT